MTSKDKIRIRISESVWNPHFRYMNDAEERYLVIYGSAGSGKSYYIVQRYIRKMLKSGGKMNLLVVRNTGRTNRDSTFALFKQIITKWGLYPEFRINSADMRIICGNGSEIIFSGLDDVEKLKSITFTNGELTDIWIEEASEISEADFNQLDIRLRGRGTKKQIVLSFNPIDVNHWLKRRFCDDPKDDVILDHSTYKDNGHLDEEYIKLLESYRDTDPYYYEVYCLGNWGVLGNTVFDANQISRRLAELKEPLKRGSFTYSYDGLKITGIEWVDDPNGFISIYREPESMKYCIGGDTAGEGSDYFIGQVVSREGEQVAVLRQQTDSDLYTKQMYCLGKYYNNALLAIETNFDSYPIQELQRLGYMNMYVRQVNDTALERYKKSYGFKTDAWTRPKILGRLIEIVRDHVEFFNDRLTLEEMLTFVRNDKSRMEAKSGAHDDLVMAVAIAYEGLNQVITRKEKTKIDYKSYNAGIDYWG